MKGSPQASTAISSSTHIGFYRACWRHLRVSSRRRSCESLPIPLYPNHLLKNPKSQSTPGAIILSVTYGLDPKSSEDPFLNPTIKASHALASALVPGKFLVDAIPIRVYLYAHLTPTDEMSGSTVSPRLVPRNGLQGSCQGHS